MDNNAARRFGAEPVRFGRRVDTPPVVPPMPTSVVTPQPRTPVIEAPPPVPSSRDEDLRAFFGPKAATYLLLYRAWQKTAPSPEQSILSWRRPLFQGLFWGGLFGFVPWLFYRKLYGIGAAALVGTIAINLIVPSPYADELNVAIGLFFMRYGQPLYIAHALRRIEKADMLGFIGENRTAYLRRSGGSSMMAALVAMLVASIAGVFFLMP